MQTHAIVHLIDIHLIVLKQITLDIHKTYKALSVCIFIII